MVLSAAGCEVSVEDLRALAARASSKAHELKFSAAIRSYITKRGEPFA